MKLTIEQKAIAIEEVAIMSRKGEHIDAMTLARTFNRTNGTALDWHEFSYLLDELNTKGIVRYACARRNDGLAAYELNSTSQPEYNSNCPACLRHQSHTEAEHDAALRRNYRCSLPGVLDGESDF